MSEDTAASRLYRGRFQPDFLVRGLSHDLQRALLHDQSGRPITAGEFRDLTSQYCQALALAGLAKGDRVAVLSGNRPEVLVVAAALLEAPVVALLLEPHAPARTATASMAMAPDPTRRPRLDECTWPPLVTRLRRK